MAAPKSDAPLCDLLGCGHIAEQCSDGTEVDSQGLKRPAIPNINTCARHENYPHSEDAKTFAQTSDKYRNRAVLPSTEKKK